MESGFMVIGLILIILGWLVQLYYSAVKRIFALSLKFLVIYVVGCIFLIIDASQTGNTLIWILNLVIVVVASIAGYFAKKARR
jgi:CDP-diglyceride synthetase